jgi:hypothetical protein
VQAKGVQPVCPRRRSAASASRSGSDVGLRPIADIQITTQIVPMIVAKFIAVGLILVWPARVCAQELEGPTVTTTIRIERETGGNCSVLRADTSSHNDDAPFMSNVCHGWETVSCGTAIFVRGNGVVEDQAQILFAEPHEAMLDLVPLVDQAIDSRWPAESHVHLIFGPVTCEGSLMVVQFSGSHLMTGASGSTEGMVGQIRLASATEFAVSVEAEMSASHP